MEKNDDRKLLCLFVGLIITQKGDMLLDRSQIEQWADTYNAKGDFPLLIQKLVYASTSGLTKCNIPFGNAVNMGGFDGEIDSAQAWQ